jgi:hypothetical protein
MSQRLRIPLALAASLLLALAGIGVVGCAKKLTAIDASLAPPTFPEGVRDTGSNTPSDLVVWPDVPNEVEIAYADTTRAHDFFTRYRADEGASIGTIIDYTGSAGYQMFRRENGGGFRRLFDFALTATRRWGDRSYFGTIQGTVALPSAQMFAFTDATPPAIDTLGYMGRAVVSGISGAHSPLTNLGEVAGGVDLIGWSIDFTDSLLDIRWTPVPGAKGYWVHIYQPRNDLRTSVEAIETGLVAPVAIGKARDLFIGYFPATEPGYELGNPVPPGARILFYRVLQGASIVLVRISAVDSAGQLIATHGVDPSEGGDLGAWLEEDRVNGSRTLVFPLRAVAVTIGRPGGGDEPGPDRLSGHVRLSRAVSGVPGMAYYRPAQVGHVRSFP